MRGGGGYRNDIMEESNPPPQVFHDNSTGAVQENIVPSAKNFERVSFAISTAINTVNVIQESPNQIDATDLNETYNNFNLEKYEAVMGGERRYKYLTFEKYWRFGEQRIQALVTIPKSEDGRFAREYVHLILETLHNQHHIDVSQVDAKEIELVARDVEGLGRFTCIKFLRLVWALFSDGEENAKGIFPQVYQIQVVDAGDLSYQVTGNRDMFKNNPVEMVRPSFVRYANVTNAKPEGRPNLFDQKIVVFFRPKGLSPVDNGHVGVGRLEAEVDKDGRVNRFTISTVEVNGVTGQAFYYEREDLDHFRQRLYLKNSGTKPTDNQVVGWFIQR